MIRRFEIWLADLNPGMGTEPGKTRPVLLIQTDLLNASSHPSTIICPITTRLETRSRLIRLRLSANTCGLDHDSEVMLDQMRAFDNRRLRKKLGELPEQKAMEMQRLLKSILDLE